MHVNNYKHKVGEWIYDKEYNRLGVITNIRPNSRGDSCYLIDWVPHQNTVDTYIHYTWIEKYKEEYKEMMNA
jgi:hypothetical protein